MNKKIKCKDIRTISLINNKLKTINLNNTGLSTFERRKTLNRPIYWGQKRYCVGH